MKHRSLRSDRRTTVRGGRRSSDYGGHAPMIVVIDEDAERRDVVEAALAQRRFAVAPFQSVEQAIPSLRTLRPQAVVASVDVAATLRVARGAGSAGRAIPTLPVTSQTLQPDRLVASLRRLLRRAR